MMYTCIAKWYNIHLSHDNLRNPASTENLVKDWASSTMHRYKQSYFVLANPTKVSTIR